MNSELISSIKNFLNHPWKRQLVFEDRVKWEKIWASIDTFEDTELAISHYLKLKKFHAFNGGYLYIYGVFQAMNLQQDAINNLCVGLFNKSIEWKNDYPELYKIREYRNDSIGHPSKRGNNYSFHMIGRHSISNNGFLLASFYPKTGEKSKFDEIKIIDCIKIQEELVNEILLKTMDELKREFSEHKKKFKDKTIQSELPGTLSYHISKLFEHVSRDYPLVGIDFDVIKDTIVKVKLEIEKRYFKLSALSGVEENIIEIEYIINRLETTLIKSKINDQFELNIFIKMLRLNFDELLIMIKEIDNEFK